VKRHCARLRWVSDDETPAPQERTIADSSYIVPSTWHFEASFHAGDDADGGQGEEAQLEKTRASVPAKVAQSEVELC